MRNLGSRKRQPRPHYKLWLHDSMLEPEGDSFAVVTDIEVQCKPQLHSPGWKQHKYIRVYVAASREVVIGGNCWISIKNNCVITVLAPNSTQSAVSRWLDCVLVLLQVQAAIWLVQAEWHFGAGGKRGSKVDTHKRYCHFWKKQTS